MKYATIVTALILLAGCKPPVCEPGETQTCHCPEGLEGAQVCNLKGTGWEGCQCQNPATATGEKESPPEMLANAANRDWSGTSAPTGTGLHGTQYEKKIEEAGTAGVEKQAPEAQDVGAPHKAPETVVGVGDTNPKAGTLPPQVIKAAMKSHLAKARTCYEKELENDPDLEGKVTISFTIGANGKVKSASVKSSTLGSQKVESCIVDDAKTWTFPAPEGGGEVVVTYPIIFSSSQ